MKKNNFAIVRGTKAEIKYLEAFLNFEANAIYDQAPKIKYVKIAIIFTDKNDCLADSYFYTKDRINKMSRNAYNRYLMNKLEDFFKTRVNKSDLKMFEASICLTH